MFLLNTKIFTFHDLLLQCNFTILGTSIAGMGEERGIQIQRNI